MTDHDRGAYAPQDDEPLSFDARRPSERRPVPMTLVGSAIVLVALIGGVALVYRGGVRRSGEGPRPVGEPVMSVKTAAAPPPIRDESGEAGVYAPTKPSATVTQTTTTTTQTAATNGVAGASTPNSSALSGAAPIFAVSPEQPAPRPAPQPHSLALLTKPPVAAVKRPTPPIVAASPTSGAPDDAEVAAAGATTHSENTSTRAASARESAQMKLADATPTRRAVRERTTSANTEADNLAMARLVARSTTPTDAYRASATLAPTRLASTPGGAVVQIGAFSSAEQAAKGYADVASDMSGRMSGKSKHVLPLEVNGKTLYRTWLSGFASRGDAIAFCETLRTKNKSCIVKG